MTDEQAEIRMWAVTRPIYWYQQDGPRECLAFTVAMTRTKAIERWIGCSLAGLRAKAEWRRLRETGGYRAQRVTIRVDD